MTRENYLEDAEKILLQHFSGDIFSVTRETAKNTFDQGQCDTLFVRMNSRGRQRFLLRTHVAPDGTVHITSTPIDGGSRCETIPLSKSGELRILEEYAQTHVQSFTPV